MSWCAGGGGRAQGRAVGPRFEELCHLARLADRPGQLLEQRLAVELGRPLEVVAPDGEIDAAAEAEGAATGHQVHVQLGMQGLEGGPARDQPAHQQGWLAGDDQRRRPSLPAQRLRRLADAAQPLPDRLIEPLPRFGQKDPALAPFEQHDPEILFQQAYRPADRAVGEVQLVGGAAEVFGTGRHLETAQRGQGRQRQAFL